MNPPRLREKLGRFGDMAFVRETPLSQTPEYATWNAMRRRCHNPKSDSFRFYGARGITVCEEWRESFGAFLQSMGKRPDGHSLDRIDPLGNYEPSNCRWASQETQQNNRTNNHRITAYGKTLTVAEWARELGVKRVTLVNRIRRGLPIERILMAGRINATSHGTTWQYQKGCRCTECRVAIVAYNREYRARAKAPISNHGTITPNRGSRDPAPSAPNGGAGNSLVRS